MAFEIELENESERAPAPPGGDYKDARQGRALLQLDTLSVKQFEEQILRFGRQRYEEKQRDCLDESVQPTALFPTVFFFSRLPYVNLWST